MEITMADYYQPTVVQQIIPDADMTPLERLLLGEIFQSERVNDGWYFFAEDDPAVVITVQRAELDQALAAPHDRGNSAYRCVIEQIETADPETVEVDLDLSTTSWEFFLQDIVKRSTTVAYISVVAALTCNRMRADGFGGLAILITPDAIVAKSTGDFLEDMIAEAGLDNEERPGTKTSDSPAAAS
jgi:hypothetical protein